MKSILLFLFLSVSAANAAQVMHCEGGAGGPGPATAILKVQEACGITFIRLELSNSAVSAPLKGSFQTSILDQPTDSIYATGMIGGVEGNVYLNAVDNGKYQLVIYAGRDNRVEFGFGAHLLCTPAN